MILLEVSSRKQFETTNDSFTVKKLLTAKAYVSDLWFWELVVAYDKANRLTAELSGQMLGELW